MTAMKPAIDEDFFSVLEMDLPVLDWLDPEAMPEPYRHLLVHDGDMTGRLEAFYSQAIHLQTLKLVRKSDFLYRRVLLKTERGQIVEFGAIRIHLEFFQGEPRQRVLGCRQPLGGILNEFQIPYRSRLHGFFKLPVGAFSHTFPGVDGVSELFGRVNRLVGRDEQPIARVIEILPPQA